MRSIRTASNGSRMLSVNKSAFFAAALVAGLSVLPGLAAAQQVRLLVQSSPLAGFNYHQAPEVWRGMRVGDALRLEREPDNVHDAQAISVQWQGHKLGYVPRAQNAALAWAMDRGESLDARVSRLQPHRNPVSYTHLTLPTIY